MSHGHKRTWRLATVAACVLLFLAGCERAQPPAAPATRKPSPPKRAAVTVGLLMETYDVDRWKRDEDAFRATAASRHAEVIRAVAGGDQDRQNKQADTMLTQGVDVLVVIPKNLETASVIIKNAHEKGVPVVAYDRLIRHGDLDVYVTFDNEKVGYLQAKGVLDQVPEGSFILLGGAATDNNAKLLRRGQRRAIEEHEKRTGKKVQVLADPFLDNWDREEARRRISSMLTRFKAEGKRIDAIVASNDSTAGGAVAALKAEGLAGKVAVSGQDAELTACQRVVDGTQTVTVYKPVKALASVAAEVAVRLARGEQAEAAIRAMGHAVRLLDNGKKRVPSIFLEPVFVTRENMAATVIRDGWHPLDKVYANQPKAQWPQAPAGN